MKQSKAEMLAELHALQERAKKLRDTLPADSDLVAATFAILKISGEIEAVVLSQPNDSESND